MPISGSLTVPIAANADDYYQDATSATYPVVTAPAAQTGVNLLQAGRSLNGTTYELRVALLRFDTSALPDDATITGASLLLTPSDASSGPSTNTLNLLGEYYTWNGTAADWTNGVPASPILSIVTSTFNGSTATRSVTITDLTGISLSGNTNIRLTVSQRAANAAPTGFNYVNIASLEHATLQEPRLVVNYTIPGETLRPTGVSGLSGLTGAATDIDQDPDDASITDAGLLGTDPSGVPGSVANVYPNARAAYTGQTQFPWDTPANVTDTSDTTLASIASASTAFNDYFSFASGAFSAIPAGATINSITATIKQIAGTANRAQTFLTLLSANGAAISSEVNTVSNTVGGTSNVANTAGGTTSSVTAWGTLPTLAQLQTSTFGLRLRIARSNTTTYGLYSIKLTVNYTTQGATTNTQADIAMGDPVDSLLTGAASGELRALMRKKGSGSNPTGRVEVRNAAGTLLGTPIANQTLTSTSWTVFSGTFDQSIILSKTDVVLRFVGAGATGGLAEIGPVEWNAKTQAAAAQPITLVGAVGIRGAA